MFSTQVCSGGAIIQTMFFWFVAIAENKRRTRRKTMFFLQSDFTDLCLCRAQSAVTSPPPISPCPAPYDPISRPRLEASFTLSCSIFCSISFSLCAVLYYQLPLFPAFWCPFPPSSQSLSEHFSLSCPRFWQPGGTRSAISEQFITCRMFWVKYQPTPSHTHTHTHTHPVHLLSQMQQNEVSASKVIFGVCTHTQIRTHTTITFQTESSSSIITSTVFHSYGEVFSNCVGNNMFFPQNTIHNLIICPLTYGFDFIAPFHYFALTFLAPDETAASLNEWM